MRILSPSADIRRWKNCCENEASNWTPGGHIRARGDRRRTRGTARASAASGVMERARGEWGGRESESGERDETRKARRK